MRVSIVVFVSLVFVASAARGQHEDVVPYELEGRIATGGHDDVLATDNVVQRVFGYDFGEDPEDPYFIGDPGFNNGAFAIGVYPNDGLLPANFTLGFNVLTNLQYWDGSGGVNFAAAPAGVELGLNRSSNTVLIGGAGTSGTVPSISGTGASGRVHEHINSLLLFDGSIDPEEPNAPDGIYLVGVELKLPGSGLLNSEPIYLVYNNGLEGEEGEEIHDMAIEWVEMTLVPEPSSWVLMAAGLASMISAVWRKRRRAFDRL